MHDFGFLFLVSKEVTSVSVERFSVGARNPTSFLAGAWVSSSSLEFFFFDVLWKFLVFGSQFNTLLL